MKRRDPHRLRRLGVAAAAVTIVSIFPHSSPLHAQDGSTLIRQGIAAYNNFDISRAVALLRRGVNPSAGPQDTLWARGVQFLAQALFDDGQENQVEIWARWAMRQRPGLAIDSLNLVSDVIDAFSAARAATASGSDDAAVTTTFQWPAGDPGSGPGRFMVTPPGIAAPVTVLVVGRGVVTPGQRLSLPAGSYVIRASAPGHAPIQVTREVLPGVTTILALALQPQVVAEEGVLAPATRDRAVRQVAAISAYRFGTPPSCGGGALVGRDGLLLTTYHAVRGVDSLAIRLNGQTFREGIEVAAYSVDRNLAVLKVPVVRSDSLPMVEDIADAQYAWAVGFTECTTPAEQRVRVVEWEDPPAGDLTLEDSVIGAVSGSPLIDESGALVGMWTAGRRVTPAPRTAGLAGDARRSVREGGLRTVAEVASVENHRYGSIEITTSVTGAVVRITPLEPWHWPELATTSFAPVAYSGPAGRYTLELTVNGDVRRRMDFLLRAGVADRLAVEPGEPEAPSQVAQRRGGGFPWIIAVLGGGGAAAAAALLLGGGGGTEETTGSVIIRVRDP